jgi:hypothetical protein
MTRLARLINDAMPDAAALLAIAAAAIFARGLVFILGSIANG